MPEVVIKEVEVVKEVIVEKEVIKEVPVEKVVEVIKEVIVEKEVIKEVPVEKVIVVEKIVKEQVVVTATPTPIPTPTPDPGMIDGTGPGIITYQGSLTTPNGDPQASGTYDMEFKLWGAASGGTMYWMESHGGVNAVVVTNGVFSVNLGSITPFPGGLFSQTPALWLEVAADVDGNGMATDEIYSPRVQFTAPPYAFHSDNADKVDGLDASAFIKGSASAYIVVETTDHAVTNGANLIAAYAAARALTPHGQALGTDNRAVVIVPPGKYDLGTGQLEMDTEFVDVAGLSTLRENQHIYGRSNGYGTGVLRQTANNVKIENLFVELADTGLTMSNNDDKDPTA